MLPHVVLDTLRSEEFFDGDIGDRVQFTEVISLDPSTFKKVPCLRLLKLLKKNSQIEFEFPRGLDGTFPDKLRFLEWYYYPLESLGSNFTPHNLVHLSMVRSQLKKLWNETQDVNNLKYVNLSHSKNLTCFPNLSKANLQMLRLHGCTSLVDLPPLRFHNILDNAEKEFEVMHKYNCLMLQFINHKVYDEHKSIHQNVQNVRHLKIESDVFMNIIPSLLDYVWTDGAYSCLLDLKGCSNLRSLSVMFGNIKFICLRSTAIKELHSSIGNLKNLLVLDLCNCKCIKNFPTSIRNLESLEYLDMFGCKSIEKFPELPKNIKGLDLSRTSIQQVDSSSFECLPCLHILYMNSCIELESLPTSICKLKSLVRLDLGKCSRLKSFPKILEPMEKLEKLNLKETRIEEMPSTIENLVVLDHLSLCNCKNLKCIPITICKLKSLTELHIRRCSQLKNFLEILEPMENLEELHLDETGIEVLPPSIERLVLVKPLLVNYVEKFKIPSAEVLALSQV
ncbi:disease resistance protein RUN1-like [Humulus lupulus]|uniref:disease resistance protein RUN1-like n=1 Tax=Humulus lupulus TaxID=3486 RepID=UPI002B408D35|nr:disease resistance protein RUN1-like [Humulus lupulus]